MFFYLVRSLTILQVCLDGPSVPTVQITNETNPVVEGYILCALYGCCTIGEVSSVANTTFTCVVCGSMAPSAPPRTGQLRVWTKRTIRSVEYVSYSEALSWQCHGRWRHDFPKKCLNRLNSYCRARDNRLILRGAVIISTRHSHKNLYITVFLISILGLDYYPGMFHCRDTTGTTGDRSKNTDQINTGSVCRGNSQPRVYTCIYGCVSC